MGNALRRREPSPRAQAPCRPVACGLAAALALAGLLGACAPEAPLRVGVADGEGAMLAGCQNLSRSARPDRFVSEFYLSTWTSAFAEGAIQGLAEGMANRGPRPGQADGMGPMGDRDTPPGVRALNQPTTVRPFCRIVPLPPGQAVREIATTMAQVARPIQGASTAPSTTTPRGAGALSPDLVTTEAVRPGGATFWTDYQLTKSWAAIWYDRYVFNVRSGQSPGTSEIRILRRLYISRDREIYNQAFSSGQNEAWIINRLDATAPARPAR